MIGGYAALEAAGDRPARRGIFFLFLVVFGSNLPDLDFLVGLLYGDATLYHRGPSHSLLAAMAVAVAFGAGLRTRHGGMRAVMATVFLAYGSHLLLDMVIRDPSGDSVGVPLLWPLYRGEIGLLIPGLQALDPLRWLDHEALQQGFLRSLFSLGGVRVFLVDAVLVAPLVPLAWGVVRMRRRWLARHGQVGRLGVSGDPSTQASVSRAAPRGRPSPLLVRSSRLL